MSRNGVVLCSPQPSLASYGAAWTTRLTMRPISALAPGNALGALMVRTWLNTAVRTLAPPRAGTVVVPVRERTEDGWVLGEWVCAPGVDRRGPAVLYLHGSAFVACSPRTHRGLVAELSAASGRPVFALTYRLAPQHRFPTAAHDAARAYRWLLADEPGRAVALAGDSAGGQLAVATALHAREQGLPAPAAVLLLSPVLDLTLRLALGRDRRAPDPFASGPGAQRIIGMYTAGADPADPGLAVLDADLTGFPPTLIQAGGREMLLDDARALAERLDAVAGDCTLEIWRGQMHVFPALYRLVPEAREAIERAAAFLNARFG